MKDVLLDKIGNTENGLYRHAEVHEDGSVYVYKHFYQEGVAKSELLILYPEDMEKVLPVIQEQRSKMVSAT